MKPARKVLTLALIRDSSKVLLGMKKRGFGEGRWNGFGGKVEPGETIEAAARRELTEESGIEAEDLTNVGLLEFEFIGDPVLLEVHVFAGSSYRGQPTETEEMRPQWFSVDELPFEKMWPDDRQWFPLLLKGSKFRGYFVFEGLSKIISSELHEVEDLSLCEENSS